MLRMAHVHAGEAKIKWSNSDHSSPQEDSQPRPQEDSHRRPLEDSQAIPKKIYNVVLKKIHNVCRELNSPERKDLCRQFCSSVKIEKRQDIFLAKAECSD